MHGCRVRMAAVFIFLPVDFLDSLCQSSSAWLGADWPGLTELLITWQPEFRCRAAAFETSTNSITPLIYTSFQLMLFVVQKMKMK